MHNLLMWRELKALELADNKCRLQRLNSVIKTAEAKQKCRYFIASPKGIITCMAIGAVSHITGPNSKSSKRRLTKLLRLGVLHLLN